MKKKLPELIKKSYSEFDSIVNDFGSITIDVSDTLVLGSLLIKTMDRISNLENRIDNIEDSLNQLIQYLQD
ncbi:hypothetical protein RJG79_08045 [Mycoplasmatota bacterium WC44]